MLCDEHAAARAQMCDALVDSPLLLNKLWGIAKSFNTRAKVFDTLRGHRRKVRWHLSRIYHTRNSIVHDASAMPYLPTLVENLHVYVDSLIKAVQKTAMISPEHLTVDGALQYLSAWESYRLKALQDAPNKNEKLKDSDVWDVVFGHDLTLAPVPQTEPKL